MKKTIFEIGLQTSKIGRYSIRNFGVVSAKIDVHRHEQKNLEKLIDECSSQPIHQLTLKDLTDSTKNPSNEILKGAQFVYNELPIRMAHRLRDIQELPYIVGMNPYVKQVYTLYKNSFQELVWFPPITNSKHVQEYTTLLKRLVGEHTNVIPTISRGVLECRNYISPAEVSAFLNRKIQDRIGIRVLAEQLIAVSENPHSSGVSGIINLKLNPADLIKAVGKSAQELCDINYGIYPEIIISGETDAYFPYISVHLEYIVFELLKNSMRATVEWAEHVGNSSVPPIEIKIGKSSKDITILFRDRGGGVPYDELDSIWEYSYSTVSNDSNEEEASGKGKNKKSKSIFSTQVQLDANIGAGGQMAGLGYGLPMSKVYAEFFGGNLDFVSLAGHGCDVYLRLNRLGDHIGSRSI